MKIVRRWLRNTAAVVHVFLLCEPCLVFVSVSDVTHFWHLISFSAQGLQSQFDVGAFAWVVSNIMWRDALLGFGMGVLLRLLCEFAAMFVKASLVGMTAWV